MKIQLSDKRIVPGALTVWNQNGPEVDIVMDLKNLTFRPESIEEIYVFHVLDHLFAKDGEMAIKNWKQCLAPNAKIHILNDDFEYICRAIVGGDIDIDIYNNLHNHPAQYSQNSLTSLLVKRGFDVNHIVVWYNGNPDHMEKKHYEFILTATKNG